MHERDNMQSKAGESPGLEDLAGSTKEVSEEEMAAQKVVILAAYRLVGEANKRSWRTYFETM